MKKGLVHSLSGIRHTFFAKWKITYFNSVFYLRSFVLRNNTFTFKCKLIRIIVEFSPYFFFHLSSMRQTYNPLIFQFRV